MDHYTGSIVSIEWHPDRATLRSFGVALGLLCFGRAVWSLPNFPIPVAALGLALASAALVRPSWFRMPYILLGVLSYPLRWSLAFVVLALVYFAVVTPIACGVRLLRRIGQRRTREPGPQSGWHISPARGAKPSYFRQF